ncbi:MAG TPA: TonB-dependent receptor [Vicinamibacterales bacterium]|nr:TonB-dependent receptor [Vicinamibacterales bacterium]
MLAPLVAAEAQTGRVIDGRTGAPLPGVHVAVVGSPGTVITGSDGRFTFTAAPRPPFVAVIVLGDGRVARLIHVETLPAGELTLEAHAAAEHVTVLGIAPRIDAAPGSSLALVTGAGIAAESPATIAQALDDVAGVSATSDGQAAVPTIRGLARGRTAILIDGGRVTSERRAGPSASFLDPAVVDSIAVARGPGSVAYGTDAFGGVIAVRTRRPSAGAPLAVMFSATAGAGIPERRSLVQISSAWHGGGVLALARARRASDYDSPDGPVANSSWRDAGVFASAEHQLLGGRLDMSAAHDAGRDLGRPRSDSAAVRIFSPFERSTRVSASYERARLAGLEHVRLDGLLARTHERTEQDRAAAGTRPRAIERATLSARDVQLRARAGRSVRRATLEFGADAGGRSGLSTGETSLTLNAAGAITSSRETTSIGSARRTIAGGFLQARMPLPARMVAAGGARIDRIHTSNRGGFFGDRARADTAAAGFAALTAAPGAGVSLTARLSRGFRDATLSDRYHRGPAGRGFLTGNPELAPETSLQYDLTSAYASRRLRVSASIYRYEIEDLIEIYQAPGDQLLFRNRGRARLTGGEIELNASLSGRWTAAVGAQASSGRAMNDGAPLNDIAPGSISLTLRGLVGKGHAVYARARAVARDGTPGPSEVAAPGWLDVAAGGSMKIGRHLELGAAGRNLLNRRYYASPGTRWVHAPGRNGSITLSVRFQ